MPLAPWLRALSAVGTLAEATRLFRSASQSTRSRDVPAIRDASDLERGLANVVVAALREAFDRDRARFELERNEREAIRARADRQMHAERLRQVGMQAVSQVRMLAIVSVTIWVASAAAAGVLTPISNATTWLMAVGWTSLGGALGAAFLAQGQLTVWIAREPDPSSSLEPPKTKALAVLPWLVLNGFSMTAIGLLVTL